MNALNFIGGVFVEAHDGVTIANINPATGEEIGRITRSNMADVEAAVQASRLAQNEWSALTLLGTCRLARSTCRWTGTAKGRTCATRIKGYW